MYICETSLLSSSLHHVALRQLGWAALRAGSSSLSNAALRSPTLLPPETESDGTTSDPNHTTSISIQPLSLRMGVPQPP